MKPPMVSNAVIRFLAAGKKVLLSWLLSFVLLVVLDASCVGRLFVVVGMVREVASAREVV